MKATVSFTEFREKLPEFLKFLKKGGEEVVTNAKTDEELVRLVGKREIEFDWDNYLKFVESLGGSGLLVSKKDDEVRARFRRDVNKSFSQAKRRWNESCS